MPQIEQKVTVRTRTVRSFTRQEVVVALIQGLGLDDSTDTMNVVVFTDSGTGQPCSFELCELLGLESETNTFEEAEEELESGFITLP